MTPTERNRYALIKREIVPLPEKDKMVLITGGSGHYGLNIPGEVPKYGSMFSTLRDVEKYAREASKRTGLPVVKQWEIIEAKPVPALPWFIKVEKLNETYGKSVVRVYADTAHGAEDQKWRHVVAEFELSEIEIARAIVETTNATRHSDVREVIRSSRIADYAAGIMTRGRRDR